MDRWPIFQTQTFEEFPFPVDRYEEYVENEPVIGNVFTINQLSQAGLTIGNERIAR